MTVPRDPRELGWRISSLMGDVMCCEELPRAAKAGWLIHVVLGYLETEHGYRDASGLSFAGWREDAVKAGIVIEPAVFDPHWSDDERREHRNLLERMAEVMGPVLADRLLREAKTG